MQVASTRAEKESVTQKALWSPQNVKQVSGARPGTEGNVVHIEFIYWEIQFPRGGGKGSRDLQTHQWLNQSLALLERLLR